MWLAPRPHNSSFPSARTETPICSIAPTLAASACLSPRRTSGTLRLPARAHPFYGEGLSLRHVGGGAVGEGDKPIASDAAPVVHPDDYVRGRKGNKGPGFIYDHFDVDKADRVQCTHGDARQRQELAVHQAGAAPAGAHISAVRIDTRAIGQDQRFR